MQRKSVFWFSSIAMIALLLLTATSLWSCGSSDTLPEGPAPKGKKRIPITINTRKSQRVNTDLLGFSTDYLCVDCDITNKNLLNDIDALHPKVLRFPGGAVSNLAHWLDNGLGYRLSEIPEDKKSLRRRYDEQKGATFKHVDEIIKIALRSNARLLLVANILTADEQEMLDQIAYVKSKGVGIAGVELGNEVYSKEMSKIISFEQYLTKCKAYTRALRKNHPEIKIGVVAAHSPTMRKNDPYFIKWNEDLAKENFYDAYIVHIYSKIKNCSDRSNLEEQFNCGNEQAGIFLGKKLPNLFRYYQKLYGTSKKMWVTEWNISPRFSDGVYGNSVFHALYATDFIFSMMEANQQYPILGKAVYHNLCTKWLGFALINDRQGQEAELSSESYMKRANYYSFLLLSRIFNNQTNHVELSGGGFDQNNVTGPRIRAFHNTSTNKLYLYVSNSTGAALDLSSVQVNGTSLAGNIDVQVASLAGNSLYASIGLSKMRNDINEVKGSLEYTTKNMQIKTLQVPAYSLSCAEVQL